MKLLYLLAVAAVVVLIGCGGGGDSEPLTGGGERLIGGGSETPTSQGRLESLIGRGGDALTVGEYATACGDIVESLNRFDEVFESANVSDALDAVEDAVSDLRKLKPPEELKLLHATRIDMLQFTSKAIKDLGIDDLFNDLAEMEKDAEDLSESEAMKRMADLAERMESWEEEIEKLEPEIERLDTELEEAESELSPATQEILYSQGCEWN